MRISTFSTILFLGWIVLFSPARARDNCQVAEKAESHNGGGKMIFASPGHNGRVIVTLASNAVEVSGFGAKSCETYLEDLWQVYFSASGTLLLRSSQVASDTIFFINSENCKSERTELNVFGDSEALLARKLRDRGYCIRPAAR